ncbi:MAG: hypothetical protein HYW95_00410 [Candidatus Wildermuthbacteria bacterium]|nr:hypothetical protein [Candidatus Wildermuthbacteria bacterium]
MAPSARQRQILASIVTEHIRSALPVSSQFIEETYTLGVSPATIRNDMKQLDENGYLFQPHTSAGRIPTDKGYRFFVDEIVRIRISHARNIFAVLDRLQNGEEDMFQFVQLLMQRLANASSALTVAYFTQREVMWKEGWEQVLEEPEFEDRETIFRFTQFIEDIQEHMEQFEEGPSFQIFIGGENPFSEVEDFSIIIGDCAFSGGVKGKIAMIGPKRMAYQKNIGLLHALAKRNKGSK